jgi:hypothetical protein
VKIVVLRSREPATRMESWSLDAGQCLARERFRTQNSIQPFDASYRDI